MGTLDGLDEVDTVGVSEGLKDGCLVGSLVVANCVGAPDGLLEGISVVGDMVGLSVGLRLGKVVDGALVGLVEAIVVGSGDGTSDGDVDVVARVGITDGCAVAELVGN